jgi:uncharacterized membrane protein YphA (DoxX/SURF4 family)
MSQPQIIPGKSGAVMLVTSARLILGAAYLYMGAAKALHPVEFLKLVRQYDLFHHAALLNAIAAWLPWFEIVCGILLIAGIAVRGTALVSLAMLIPFTAVVFHRALALQSAQSIPFCMVKFDCGCGNGEEFICHKLAENLALIALSLGLLVRGGRRSA